MATATATPPTSDGDLPSHVIYPQPGDPLWGGYDIEMISVTGDFASGKTLFCLSIDPQTRRAEGDPRTLVFDFEGSASPYKGSLNFSHVNAGREIAEQFPGGCKPMQTFLWWKDRVQQVAKGAYDVIVIDPVSEVETGLADWVRDHPSEFGHTAGQYQKMQGLFWGDVKDYWKNILNTIVMPRCQTLATTAHLRSEWINNQSTGRREPKGKETIMELATVYLWLDRAPESKSKQAPRLPRARVLKSRLVKFALGETDQDQPILPPMIPDCTPTQIRRYIQSPPDYSKLKPGERLPEDKMSDDQKLMLQAQIADSQRDSEQAKLSQLEMMVRSAQTQQAQQQGAAPQPSAGGASAETLDRIRKGIATVYPDRATAEQEFPKLILEVTGRNKLSELDEPKAKALLEWLRRIAAGQQRSNGDPKTPATAQPQQAASPAPSATESPAQTAAQPPAQPPAAKTETAPFSAPLNGRCDEAQVDKLKGLMREIREAGAGAAVKEKVRAVLTKLGVQRLDEMSQADAVTLANRLSEHLMKLRFDGDIKPEPAAQSQGN